jgi:hypothetical protein
MATEHIQPPQHNYEQLRKDYIQHHPSPEKPGFWSGIGTAIKLAFDLYWYPEHTQEIVSKIPIPDFQNAMRWFSSEKKVQDLTKQRLKNADQNDLECAAFFATTHPSIQAVQTIANNFFRKLQSPLPEVTDPQGLFLKEMIQKWRKLLSEYPHIEEDYEKIFSKGTHIEINRQFDFKIIETLQTKYPQFPSTWLHMTLFTQTIFEAYQTKYPEKSDQEIEQMTKQLLITQLPNITSSGPIRFTI